MNTKKYFHITYQLDGNFSSEPVLLSGLNEDVIGFWLMYNLSNGDTIRILHTQELSEGQFDYLRRYEEYEDSSEDVSDFMDDLMEKLPI